MEEEIYGGIGRFAPNTPIFTTHPGNSHRTIKDQGEITTIILTMQRIIKVSGLILSNCLAFVVLLVLLGRSDALPADNLERIRRYTRAEEFNYVQWMLDALALKNAQAALDPARYLSIAEQREVIFQHLSLVAQIDRLNYEVSVVYSDPNEQNPAAATAEKRDQLKKDRALEARLGALAESNPAGPAQLCARPDGPDYRRAAASAGALPHHPPALCTDRLPAR